MNALSIDTNFLAFILGSSGSEDEGAATAVLPLPTSTSRGPGATKSSPCCTACPTTIFLRWTPITACATSADTVFGAAEFS
jgi:hypothetical protein